MLFFVAPREKWFTFRCLSGEGQVLLARFTAAEIEKERKAWTAPIAPEDARSLMDPMAGIDWTKYLKFLAGKVIKDWRIPNADGTPATCTDEAKLYGLTHSDDFRQFVERNYKSDEAFRKNANGRDSSITGDSPASTDQEASANAASSV